MKITPMASGQAMGSIDAGNNLLPSSGDHQADRVKPNIRSIKMTTQRSVNRELAPALEEETPAAPEQSSSLVDNVQATVEDTKPLSPQFAALAKQRRALQVKESELAAREAKLSTPQEGYISVAELQANPLKIFDSGLTYDQLTEALLSGQNGDNPKIQALEAKLKSIEDGFEKKLTDRDTQARAQIRNEFMREAANLVSSSEDYEMVRLEGRQKDAVDLIERWYDKTGEVLEVSEALQEVENELLQKNLKIAQAKKIRSQIMQEQAALQPQQPQRQMRTLTARDSATPQMDKRARAIAAAMGTLKK